MFNRLGKNASSHTNRAADLLPAATEAMVVRVPQWDGGELTEPSRSYACLNDLFNDLVESQHPQALSKW
jgi:hypothetical protein